MLHLVYALAKRNDICLLDVQDTYLLIQALILFDVNSKSCGI